MIIPYDITRGGREGLKVVRGGKNNDIILMRERETYTESAPVH